MNVYVVDGVIVFANQEKSKDRKKGKEGKEIET